VFIDNIFIKDIKLSARDEEDMAAAAINKRVGESKVEILRYIFLLDIIYIKGYFS